MEPLTISGEGGERQQEGPLFSIIKQQKDFLSGSTVKESACNAGAAVPSLGFEDPLEESKHLTPVFLPGEYHWLRSLAGYKE